MKKRIILTLLVMVLILSACARITPLPQDTTPTPPSIPTTKTPLELLNEAIANTKSAETYTVQYGITTVAGDDKQETLYTQSVSPSQPLDWDTVYAQVPDFPTNTHLLPDFCSTPLQAIPSNTGTIRYEVTDLSDATMSALLYAQDTRFADAIGTVAIEVDANNRFARLECCFVYYDQNDTIQKAMIIFLTVTDF